MRFWTMLKCNLSLSQYYAVSKQIVILDKHIFFDKAFLYRCYAWTNYAAYQQCFYGIHKE